MVRLRGGGRLPADRQCGPTVTERGGRELTVVQGTCPSSLEGALGTVRLWKGGQAVRHESWRLMRESRAETEYNGSKVCIDKARFRSTISEFGAQGPM